MTDRYEPTCLDFRELAERTATQLDAYRTAAGMLAVTLHSRHDGAAKGIGWRKCMHVDCVRAREIVDDAAAQSGRK